MVFFLAYPDSPDSFGMPVSGARFAGFPELASLFLLAFFLRIEMAFRGWRNEF